MSMTNSLAKDGKPYIHANGYNPNFPGDAAAAGTTHIRRMETLIPTLLFVALGLVLAVLLTGVLGFAKGGPWYQRHATRLMNLRVGAQALALALLAVLVLLSG